MSDRDLLELAGKAAGHEIYTRNDGALSIDMLTCWNPLTDDGDRLRLARHLGINIDFADCCAWKRLAGGALIQEHWGDDWGDEAHAVLRAAAEIAKAKP